MRQWHFRFWTHAFLQRQTAHVHGPKLLDGDNVIDGNRVQRDALSTNEYVGQEAKQQVAIQSTKDFTC
jgi:hypothetical protein